MAMTAADIERLIKAGLPEADVTVLDPYNDGTHFSATVISPLFKGKSRIAQQQMVYETLGGRMGGEIHALALTTSIPK